MISVCLHAGSASADRLGQGEVGGVTHGCSAHGSC